MKKIFLALFLGILAFTHVHAQTVVVQRPGIFTDLANATGVVLSLPFTIAEGVVVGAVEATGSLFQGSSEVIVVPRTTSVSVPVVVATPQPVRPSTTIITAHEDGTITTVTRKASAYEQGTVILTPVDPMHRAGTGEHLMRYLKSIPDDPKNFNSVKVSRLPDAQDNLHLESTNGMLFNIPADFDPSWNGLAFRVLDAFNFFLRFCQ